MDEKWAAYRDAVIRLETPGGVVWVAPAPVTWTRGTYPDPEGRVICVITAHNPGGQTLSAEKNTEEQERLERKLKQQSWTLWQAAGGDPSWQHVEASAAVVGAEESEVVKLGAEFGQDAVFVLTPAGRHVVGCLSARELSTGWSVSAERPAEPTKTVALRIRSAGTIRADHVTRLAQPKPRDQVTAYGVGPVQPTSSSRRDRSDRRARPAARRGNPHRLTPGALGAAR